MLLKILFISSHGEIGNSCLGKVDVHGGRKNEVDKLIVTTVLLIVIVLGELD